MLDSKGNCRTECVTYQIHCNRYPCTKLDVGKPTDMPAPSDGMLPPAVYRGETYRTCYQRGQSHLSCYKARDKSSPLWKHAETSHNSNIGPDDGIKDYQMVKMETWPQPLHRLTAEGHDILELENLEAIGQATCLNSKEDWMQNHKVSLSFGMGSNKER